MIQLRGPVGFNGACANLQTTLAFNGTVIIMISLNVIKIQVSRSEDSGISESTLLTQETLDVKNLPPQIIVSMNTNK